MEERIARFSLGGVSPGPPRRAMSRSRVTLNRGIRETFTRRDPHGNLSASRPIMSAYGLTWDFPHSLDDSSTLEQALAYMADPGTQTIGHAKSILPAQATAELADGKILKLEQGIQQSLQVVFETRKTVDWSSSWAFGKLTEINSYPAALAFTGQREASGLDVTITLGNTECTSFAGTINLDREAKPAGYSPTGEASSIDGKIAVDIVGRLTVRLPADKALQAFRSRFTDSLTFRVEGPAPFQLVIPQATFQTTNRRVVSGNLLDYSLEFLAIKGTQPLATFSFE